MRALNLQNANATFTIASVSKDLVSNVSYQTSTRPVELDLPEGSSFLWPLREGQLTFEHQLAPGVAPTSQPATLTKTTIVVTARQKETGASGTMTLTTSSAYLTAINITTTRIQGLAMPVLTERLTYTLLVDDDGAT